MSLSFLSRTIFFVVLAIRTKHISYLEGMSICNLDNFLSLFVNFFLSSVCTIKTATFIVFRVILLLCGSSIFHFIFFSSYSSWVISYVSFYFAVVVERLNRNEKIGKVCQVSIDFHFFLWFLRGLNSSRLTVKFILFKTTSQQGILTLLTT